MLIEQNSFRSLLTERTNEEGEKQNRDQIDSESVHFFIRQNLDAYASLSVVSASS